jgi:hypothetical protein
MKLYPCYPIFLFALLLFGSSGGAEAASTNPKEKLTIAGAGSSIGTMCLYPE